MTADPVALVLAAGRGTRLGSLTAGGRAKPMLPVGDRPLIDRIVRDLRGCGVKRVLVNAFHGADELVRHARGGALGSPTEVRREAAVRGPAGSLLTFADVLSACDASVVVSGDAVIDLDYAALLGAHRRAGAVLTIVAKEVDDAARFDVLEVDATGRIVAFEQRPHGLERGLVSCGVYAISPAALEHVPAGEVWDYADVYRSLEAAGQPAHAFAYVGYWNDVGSPLALWAANLAWVGGELRDSHAAGPAWVEPSATVAADARLGGRVAIGAGATVGAGAELDDVVVLPGARVPAGAVLRECLVSERETWCFATT